MATSARWQAALRAPARVRLWEYVLWPLACVLPLVAPQHALLVSEIAIVALFALSLDLLLGHAGIVSLGHAAFFGFGAYAAGLFARHALADPLAGLLFAMGLTGMLGAACSLSVLRGSDLTRLMVTLGTAALLLELANRFDGLTGGTNGLQGIAMGPVLGLFPFDLQGRTAAWYALAVGGLLFVPLRRLVHSPFGMSLAAIRDNRLRAAAIGVPVAPRLVAAYAVSAALAGAAGALLTQTTGFAAPGVLSFERSADVLVMVAIGGAGWLYGGMLGAVGFRLLQEGLSSLTPQYWMFWLGLVLVLFTLVGRDRLAHPWQTVRRMRRRLQ